MPEKTVLFASAGPRLDLYDIDFGDATLHKRASVTLPANVQYAWLHPSRRTFYVVSSNGGPGLAGDRHWASAYRVDPASGELSPQGEPVALPSRPLHVSVDRSGRFLLIAYNNPSGVTVHRLAADGGIGAAVDQPAKLDTGIYAHQVLTTPGNRTAILVARGNHAAGGKAGRSRRAEALRLRRWRADRPGFDRAGRRLRLRTAPHRFPSNASRGSSSRSSGRTGWRSMRSTPTARSAAIRCSSGTRCPNPRAPRRRSRPDRFTSIRTAASST